MVLSPGLPSWSGWMPGKAPPTAALLFVSLGCRSPKAHHLPWHFPPETQVPPVLRGLVPTLHKAAPQWADDKEAWKICSKAGANHRLLSIPFSSPNHATSISKGATRPGRAGNYALSSVKALSPVQGQIKLVRGLSGITQHP